MDVSRAVALQTPVSEESSSLPLTFMKDTCVMSDRGLKLCISTFIMVPVFTGKPGNEKEPFTNWKL